MGVAIVIQGADFSAKNLGTVTLLQDVAVTSVIINEASQSFEGIKVQLTASYKPDNTSQNVCTWSIVSGTEYASIDASSGLLAILPGADSHTVIVRATSVYNSEIYSDAEIYVTYAETVDILTSITDIVVEETLENNVYNLSPVFDPENTAYKGVQWSIVSGSSYVSLDSSTGKLTVLDTASSEVEVTIRVTSTHDTSIIHEKSISLIWKEDKSWDFSKMVGTIDLSEGLGDLLTNNDVTLFVEFSDDSTYNRLAGYNQVIVSTPIPADSSASVKNYPGAGIKLVAQHDNGIDVAIGGLKGMEYTYIDQMSVAVSKGLRLGSPAGSGNPTFPLGCEIIANSDVLIVDGEHTDMVADSGVRKGYYQYLSFGFAISVDLNIGEGKTCEDVYSETIREYPQDENLCYQRSDLKPKTIIILPGSFTDRETIMNYRHTAYVDILFDQNGYPYNAASSVGGVLSTYEF